MVSEIIRNIEIEKQSLNKIQSSEGKNERSDVEFKHRENYVELHVLMCVCQQLVE